MTNFKKYEFLDEIEILVLEKRSNEGLSYGKISKFVGVTAQQTKNIFVRAKKNIVLFNNPRNGDTKIEDTPLSTRIKWCLPSLGIEKLSDLNGMSKKKLLRIRNLGKVSVDEIEIFIYALGYKLQD